MKWTHDLRRVAKSPPYPEEVSHDRLNTWTVFHFFFWPRWWVGSNTALCNTLWKNIVKDGLAVHGLAPFLFPYPKPKAPQSQITVLRTYSFRLCVDCNVGAPRGIAHCILRKSRRSTHKLKLQGSQSLYENVKPMLAWQTQQSITWPGWRRSAK